MKKIVFWVIFVMIAGCDSNNDDSESSVIWDENTERYLVAHPTTGKRWMRCPLGQSWNENDKQCVGETEIFSCMEAKEACPSGFELASHDDFASVLCNYVQTVSDPTCPQGGYNSCGECSNCESMFYTTTSSVKGTFLGGDFKLQDDQCLMWTFDFEFGCATEDVIPADQPFAHVLCVEKFI